MEARLAPRAKRCAAGFRTSDGGGHHAADAIAADAVARDGEACGIDIELSGMLGDVLRSPCAVSDESDEPGGLLENGRHGLAFGKSGCRCGGAAVETLVGARA